MARHPGLWDGVCGYSLPIDAVMLLAPLQPRGLYRRGLFSVGTTRHGIGSTKAEI
jgi:hypothetical protein